MFRRSFKTLELPIRRLVLLAGFVGEGSEKEVEQLGVKAEFISLDEGVSRINLTEIHRRDWINGRGPKIPAGSGGCADDPA